MEFVQFHPTALYTGAIARAAAVGHRGGARRGRACCAIDAGAAIMAGRHPLADLAPRDIVAREIDAVMMS